LACAGMPCMATACGLQLARPCRHRLGDASAEARPVRRYVRASAGLVHIDYLCGRHITMIRINMMMMTRIWILVVGEELLAVA
jgi:hypothetical protein